MHGNDSRAGRRETVIRRLLQAAPCRYPGIPQAQRTSPPWRGRNAPCAWMRPSSYLFPPACRGNRIISGTGALPDPQRRRHQRPPSTAPPCHPLRGGPAPAAGRGPGVEPVLDPAGNQPPTACGGTVSSCPAAGHTAAPEQDPGGPSTAAAADWRRPGRTPCSRKGGKARHEKRACNMVASPRFVI